MEAYICYHVFASVLYYRYTCKVTRDGMSAWWPVWLQRLSLFSDPYTYKFATQLEDCLLQWPSKRQAQNGHARLQLVV